MLYQYHYDENGTEPIYDKVVKLGFFNIFKKVLFVLFATVNMYILVFFLTFDRADIYPVFVAQPYICDGPPGISLLYPIGKGRMSKFIFSVYAPVRLYLESKHLAVFDLMDEREEQSQ